MPKNLTRKQIERQDFVDNAIHDLIRKLAPDGDSDSFVAWDIKTIGQIRDVIEEVWVKHGYSEQDFYPYIKE